MSQQHKSSSFQWDDPLLLMQQLSEEERMVAESARTYCQER
jgi:glutaryl-CoA dehydrogenase